MASRSSFNEAAQKTTRTERDPDELRTRIKTLLGENESRFDERNEKYFKPDELAAILTEIEAAAIWKPKKSKPRQIKSIDDRFSSPLEVAAAALELTKADRITLLAVMLYSVFDPSAERLTTHLQELSQKFGIDVRDAVVDILEFRSLDLPPDIVDWPEKKQRERLDIHFEGSLWINKGRSYGLVAGSLQTYLHLKNHADALYGNNVNKPILTEKEEARLKLNGRYIYPRLLEQATFGRLGSELNDICFYIENPTAYLDTAKKIRGAFSPADRKIVEATLATHIARTMGWEKDLYFKLTGGPKGVWAAYDKSMRKNIPVEELGDLRRMRCIPQPAALDQWMRDLTEEDAQLSENRQVIYDRYRLINYAVARSVQESFGRLFKKGKRRAVPIAFVEAELAQMAIKEPRSDDPGRKRDPVYRAWEEKRYPHINDCGQNDHLGCPNKNGAEFFRDLIWIPLPPEYKGGPVRYVLVELQVLDPMRLLDFNYGLQASHSIYSQSDKPQGRAEDPEALAAIAAAKEAAKHQNAATTDWLLARMADLDGREYAGPKHVYVYNEDRREFYDISKNPTIGGFIDAAGLVCSEAKVKGTISNYFHPDRTYGRSTELTTGCRVSAYEGKEPR